MTPVLTLSVRVFVQSAWRPAVALLYASVGLPGWPWSKVAENFPDMPGITVWAREPRSAWIPFGAPCSNYDAFDDDTGLWDFRCTPRTAQTAQQFAETILRPISQRVDRCQLHVSGSSDTPTDLLIATRTRRTR